jgi:hypothetical protein
MNLLFVSGVGRSGTSALVNVLNANEHLLIGQERFFWKFRKEQLTPDLFEKDRFLDVRAEDTHEYAGLKVKVGSLPERYDKATYIGDKFPSLFRHFDTIFPAFPDARHLYIVRNPLSVIESYDARNKNPNDSWKLTWQDGMEAWNESVGKVAALPEVQLQKFVLVQYEELFKSTAAINAMFAELGVEPVADAKLAPFVSKFKSLNTQVTERRDDLRMFVARNADWQSYQKLCDIIDTRQG